MVLKNYGASDSALMLTMCALQMFVLVLLLPLFTICNTGIGFAVYTHRRVNYIKHLMTSHSLCVRHRADRCDNFEFFIRNRSVGLCSVEVEQHYCSRLGLLETALLVVPAVVPTCIVCFILQFYSFSFYLVF